ncbi:hypothetical protein TNCV_1353971 [Trichonephila clavipes]|nr:hypothetical protein TNCV_1353971 [Trichonephila clavipes]
MLENDEDANFEETEQTPKTSHSERLKFVETALQYFEQQVVSVMDLLLLRRLRDEAAKCGMHNVDAPVPSFYQRPNFICIKLFGLLRDPGQDILLNVVVICKLFAYQMLFLWTKQNK